MSTVSTYTVSNLFASAAITGGSSVLTITANTTSTVLPNSPGFSSVTDITHGTGSGTVGTIVTNSYTGNKIAIVFPNTISSGDQLVLTIGDIVNPSGSSSTNTMFFQGRGERPQRCSTVPAGEQHLAQRVADQLLGDYLRVRGWTSLRHPDTDRAQRIRSVDHAVVLTSLPGTVLPVSTSSRVGPCSPHTRSTETRRSSSSARTESFTASPPRSSSSATAMTHG